MCEILFNAEDSFICLYQQIFQSELQFKRKIIKYHVFDTNYIEHSDKILQSKLKIYKVCFGIFTY